MEVIVVNGSGTYLLSLLLHYSHLSYPPLLTYFAFPRSQFTSGVRPGVEGKGLNLRKTNWIDEGSEICYSLSAV